jgi:hypothetical protein
VSKPTSDEPQVRDYFGTFLETVKQASPEYPDIGSSAATEDAGAEAPEPAPGAEAGQAPTGSPTADASSGTSSSPTSIQVLQAIGDAGDGIPLSDLLVKLGVGALDAGRVLEPLVQSQFVSISGTPGQETVTLTPLGSRLRFAEA